MGYTVAKYLRLSIDDTKQESLSIENQRILLDAFISDMDEDDVEVTEFVDNGYSGTNFERPAVQELLELVQTRNVDCIIVKDFSRFGRNMVEAGYFLQVVFPLFQTRFISVSDDYDSADYEVSDAGMDVAFKLLISEQYSRDLSRKIKSAKKAKAERGEFVTKNCIFGYKKAGKRLEIDEPAAEVVRMIFRMRKDGHTLTNIAIHLYENKYPTISEYKKKESAPSCIWSKSMIEDMLSNEQYIGTYIAGKTRNLSVGSSKVLKVDESEWIKIPGHHPAIIDEDVFAFVNDKGNYKKEPLRKRKIGTSERYKPVKSQLHGKVCCGCCNHTMKPSSTRNIAFHCNYTLTAPDVPCHRHRVSSSELSETVLEMIKQKASSVVKADGAVTKPLSEEEYEQIADNFKKEKKVLYERFVRGEITVFEYVEAKNAIDAERKRLNIKSCVPHKELIARNAEREFYTMLEAAASGSVLTRKMVEELIDKVIVFPDGKTDIQWKLPDSKALQN